MNDLIEAKENSIAISGENPYLSLMNKVVEKGDMSQLEKLMDMQERWEANEAKKAYVRAMADFKANAPSLVKDKRVYYRKKDGSVVDYKHAQLSSAASAIAQELSRHGFSHAWKTSQQDNVITVSCIITHQQGHSESVQLSGKPDDSGGKNSIQAVGSVVSYLQRYTLLAATGLAAQEQDDDGVSSSKPPVDLITEKQVKEIEDLAKQKGVAIDKVLSAYALADLSEISQERFPIVISRLKSSGGK